MNDANPTEAILRARAVSKSFPGVKALEGVDFTVRAGEIHALMGENGAGKSTLIKVLTGVYRRDAGEIYLGNNLIDPRTPDEAQRLGISTVYQEVNLVPHLSVAENICLGRQRTTLGLLKWKEIRERAEKALARLGIEHDVTETLANNSIAIQQLVAIARALDTSARLLILDEPTSSLDEGEVERLFGIMRKLKGDGMGIIFVTHFLDQVYAVSDRITVLRNGKLVGEYPAAELPRVQLISKMMGKELSELDLQKEVSEHKTPLSERAVAPVLELKGVGRKNSIKPIDLQIGAGEIVGLAGLLGSGRTETARIVFGLDPGRHRRNPPRRQTGPTQIRAGSYFAQTRFLPRRSQTRRHHSEPQRPRKHRPRHASWAGLVEISFARKTN